MGCRWGSGSCSYVDGSIYEGQWKGDQRSGSGTLKRPDGYCYTGEWLADRQHGTGELVWCHCPTTRAWL